MSVDPDAGPTDRPTRRAVLRRAAVGTVAAAGVGAGTASAQEPYDGWFTGEAKGGATDNYDGTVDLRGEDSITVEVGADGNGGTFAFEPAAVRVDPGTEIVFEWVSDTHNVVVEEQPGDAGWEGHDPIEDTGFSFTATLDVEGVYKYYCDPHLSLGMKGAIVVGDADVGEGGGGGGGDARPDWDGWLDGIDGGYEDLRGNEEVTVAVGASGNGGNYAFNPAGIWIDQGTTVRWDWTGEGGAHNVVEREGDFDLDSGDPVTEAGVNYENSFEEGGISKYVCIPHESLGMLGAIAVGDDVPTKEPAQAPGPGGTGDGDDGGIIANLPGGEVRSMILLTTLGFLGAAAALVLSGELFNSLQRRRERAEAAAATGDVAATEGEVVAAPVEEPAHELDHETFEPRGTWTLVLLYLLILIAMWVFTYFVEFLGRGPTVIG